MSIRSNQTGSAVTVLVLIAAVAVLGFVGYRVYSNQNGQSSSVTASSQPVASNSSVPNINKASDLDKAAAALDQTDVDGSNNADVSALDAQFAGL